MTQLTNNAIVLQEEFNLLGNFNKRLLKTLQELQPTLDGNDLDLLGLLLYRVGRGNALIRLTEGAVNEYFQNMPIPEDLLEEEELKVWTANREQWQNKCISAVRSGHLQTMAPLVSTSEKMENALFVAEENSRGENQLFVRKYFDARNIIVERMNVLLRDSDKQLITGGPGTGKTYSVQEIIGNRTANYAAPSGKAAKNLNADGQTIHQLLGSNPITGAFKYNKNNPLPSGKVYVIDEASMIDYEIFAALLQAIPDDAKLFILGDKDQLPAVGVGDVFAELLEKYSKNKLEKTDTVRFSGQILGVAQAVNKGPEGNAEIDSIPEIEIYGKGSSKDCPIALYPNFDGKKFAEEWVQANYNSFDSLKQLKAAWKDVSYDNLPHGMICEGSEKYPELFTLCQNAWDEVVENARILCCENKGPRGVSTLNELVIEQLKGKESFRIMMVTHNLHDMGLSNGDTGLLISGYIFFKKKNHFYVVPKASISSDNIVDSFAMTIHKSQGSGYVNVAVVLSEIQDSPLLNRQILYTAITRAKDIFENPVWNSETRHLDRDIKVYGSCVILADKETVKKTMAKKEKRETGIV